MVNLLEQSLIVHSDLVKEYEHFKLLVDCPRLHICNYFNELRQKIDLTFVDQNTQLNNNSYDSTYDLNQTWSQSCTPHLKSALKKSVRFD